MRRRRTTKVALEDRVSHGQAGRRRPANPIPTRERMALSADEAFIALFIAAMHANRHMSAAEGARAHHLIWSMKRFRRKSGDTVGRTIERMRQLVGDHSPARVLAAAAGAIPGPRRLAAFALTADLLLADGTIDAAERRFLTRLGGDLHLSASDVRRVVEVMLVKNQA